eukprot:6191696-Amphidinium_carterae.1
MKLARSQYGGVAAMLREPEPWRSSKFCTNSTWWPASGLEVTLHKASLCRFSRVYLCKVVANSNTSTCANKGFYPRCSVNNMALKRVD